MQGDNDCIYVFFCDCRRRAAVDTIVHTIRFSFTPPEKKTMKSLLIALGMVAACMTTAAHSSPLTASSAPSFTSAQSSSFEASARNKHTKRKVHKRNHRAAKRV